MSGGISPSACENMSGRRRKDTRLGRVIPVQGVKDSSYMESIKNFIFDIGQQAYGSNTQTEEKETILWARMFDYQSVLCGEFVDQWKEKSDNTFETILLLLGYKNGVQAWIFEKNGDMHEILSLRQGPVKTACLLPSIAESVSTDKNAIARPLLAICMAADKKQLFTSVRILSLRTGDEIEQLKFENEIQKIRTGYSGLLVITFNHEIQVFDTTSFNRIFTIDGCYQNTGKDLNPIAISDEWLAYSPAKLIPSYQSGGGMEDDGVNSYAATVINAAKTLQKGLLNFGETVSWLAKSNMSNSHEQNSVSPRDIVSQRNRTLSGGSLPELNEKAPGFIAVLNVPSIRKLLKEENSLKNNGERINDGNIPAEAMVAHFTAHKEPIVCMEFSPCGSLLATADQQGHTFHVFSIFPHPVNARMSAVHHLYTLYRGDTSAKVLQISFSADCRWLCASTHRGTSHIFPISTYGGPATLRTHVSHRVVNRSSLFHKSAGLEDLDSAGINAGVSHNQSHCHTSILSSQRSGPRVFTTRLHNSTNPRLAPHPHPTLVQPLAQIGANWSAQTLVPKITGQNNYNTKIDKSSINWQADVVVATSFLSGKLQLSNASGHDNTHRRTHISTSSKGEQCLIIFTSTGQLTEYHFEPQAKSGLKRTSEDSPIELTYQPRFQWTLQRSKSWEDVSPPLQAKDPLFEIDNFRRQQSLAKNCVTSTNKISNSSKNHDKGEQMKINSINTGVDDSPRTQQPQSRYLKRERTASGGQYPGTEISAGRTISKHHITSESTLTTSNHSDHELQPRILPSRDDADCVNGTFRGDYRRTSDTSDHRPSSGDSMRSNKSLKQVEFDEWLSQVEMISHDGPARRLWMGPQFCFKLRQSIGSTTYVSSSSSAMFSNRTQNVTTVGSANENRNSANVGLCLEEELDVCSLNIRPKQSEPIPMPNVSSDRYGTNAITIEVGSGNFDRTSYMFEHDGSIGSLEDRRYSLEEEKLRERISQAMQESDIVVAKSGCLRTDSESSDLEVGISAELTAVGEFEFDEIEGTM